MILIQEKKVILLIKILTEDNIDEAKDLIEEYTLFLEKEYNMKKSDALNLITNNLKNVYNTYYVYFDGSTPLGLVGGRREQNIRTDAFITRIFISKRTADESIEIKLFMRVFEELSKDCNHIRIMGYQPSTNLKQKLDDLNFQQFERFFMSIPIEVVRSLPDPELPNEYHFENWNESFRDVSIDIIINSHAESIDNQVFSFFQNKTAGKVFMENLANNRWGKFVPVNSSILKHNDKPIGVCFMTIMNQGNGYIPDIALKSNYKGKGLGRSLFIRSLKWFAEKETESKAIDLDVTKRNKKAFEIYKKTGFEIKRQYNVYTWNK